MTDLKKLKEVLSRDGKALIKDKNNFMSGVRELEFFYKTPNDCIIHMEQMENEGWISSFKKNFRIEDLNVEVVSYKCEIDCIK